jgi:transcription initiation factor IIF auxiliary subunit
LERVLTRGRSNKPAVNEGFPMKEWTVELYILDQDGKEKPAKCFTKVVYNLHPSFENPTQSKTSRALGLASHPIASHRMVH